MSAINQTYGERVPSKPEDTSPEQTAPFSESTSISPESCSSPVSNISSFSYVEEELFNKVQEIKSELLASSRSSWISLGEIRKMERSAAKAETVASEILGKPGLGDEKRETAQANQKFLQIFKRALKQRLEAIDQTLAPQFRSSDSTHYLPLEDIQRFAESKNNGILDENSPSKLSSGSQGAFLKEEYPSKEEGSAPFTMGYKALFKEGQDVLKKEADLGFSLDHPHIISIYGLEEDEGENRLYQEMGLSDLTEVTNSTSAEKPHVKAFYESPLRYTHQLLSAVAHMHKRGWAHRDIKPENILLGKEGIKVCDLGEATAIEKGVPGDGQKIIGTAEFLAPEYLSERFEESRKQAELKKMDAWGVGTALVNALSKGEKQILPKEMVTPRKTPKMLKKEKETGQCFYPEPKPESDMKYAMRIAGLDTETIKTEVNNKISEVVKSLPEKSQEVMQGILEDLLQVDDNGRLTPEQVLEKYADQLPALDQ